jgi:imidazolonepropionase-like amidohydrolase
VDQVREAVRAHHAAGAGVIKVPVGGTPGLTADELAAAVDEAHSLGLKVAAHALSDGAALAARDAGVDVLAHTPTTALLDSTIAAWADGAVVSTLGAFGGQSGENLLRLSDAGATVLYGTDFGNTRDARVDPRELAALSAAGLSGEQIVASLTQTPAAFWSLEGLGQVEVGARASVLVLSADPTVDPSVLADPLQVWMDGERLR